MVWVIIVLWGIIILWAHPTRGEWIETEYEIEKNLFLSHPARGEWIEINNEMYLPAVNVIISLMIQTFIVPVVVMLLRKGVLNEYDY